MREKIGPDETEPEDFGGPKVEGDNEVWADFLDLFVPRPLSTLRTLRSSLLDLEKIRSRRCRPISVNRPLARVIRDRLRVNGHSMYLWALQLESVFERRNHLVDALHGQVIG